MPTIQFIQHGGIPPSNCRPRASAIVRRRFHGLEGGATDADGSPAAAGTAQSGVPRPGSGHDGAPPHRSRRIRSSGCTIGPSQTGCRVSGKMSTQVDRHWSGSIRCCKSWPETADELRAARLRLCLRCLNRGLWRFLARRPSARSGCRVRIAGSIAIAPLLAGRLKNGRQPPSGMYPERAKETAVAVPGSQFFNTRDEAARGGSQSLLTEIGILFITLHPIFRPRRIHGYRRPGNESFGI